MRKISTQDDQDANNVEYHAMPCCDSPLTAAARSNFLQKHLVISSTLALNASHYSHPPCTANHVRSTYITCVNLPLRENTLAHSQCTSYKMGPHSLGRFCSSQFVASLLLLLWRSEDGKLFQRPCFDTLDPLCLLRASLFA